MSSHCHTNLFVLSCWDIWRWYCPQYPIVSSLFSPGMSVTLHFPKINWIASVCHIRHAQIFSKNPKPIKMLGQNQIDIKYQTPKLHDLHYRQDGCRPTYPRLIDQLCPRPRASGRVQLDVSSLQIWVKHWVKQCHKSLIHRCDSADIRCHSEVWPDRNQLQI